MHSGARAIVSLRRAWSRYEKRMQFQFYHDIASLGVRDGIDVHLIVEIKEHASARVLIAPCW